MQTSERVNLVLRVASNLGALDWGDAEFVLDSFGVPSLNSNTQARSVAEMVRERLREAHDSQILSVAESRDIAPSVVTSEDSSDGPWLSGYVRLFISHTSTHKERVTSLKASLADLGVSGFVAHQDIQPTEEWQREIERALASCHALCAYVTPDFSSSRWTDQEVGWALGRGVPVFALRAGADPYGFFGKFQAIPVGVSGTGLGTAATTMLRKMLLDSRTTREAAPGAVGAFCASASFDVVRSNFELLQLIQSWTPPMIAQIDAAKGENRQIREAFVELGGSWVAAPLALDNLLARFRSG